MKAWGREVSNYRRRSDGGGSGKLSGRRGAPEPLFDSPFPLSHACNHLQPVFWRVWGLISAPWAAVRGLAGCARAGGLSYLCVLPGRRPPLSRPALLASLGARCGRGDRPGARLLLIVAAVLTLCCWLAAAPCDASELSCRRALRCLAWGLSVVVCTIIRKALRKSQDQNLWINVVVYLVTHTNVNAVTHLPNAPRYFRLFIAIATDCSTF